MKNLSLLFIALLFSHFTSFAQAPDLVWTKTYGGVSEEWGHFVQQTSDFGYIIAGGTESYGAGSTDIYLIKTDYLGNTLWTKTYGGPNADIAYSVQQTNDGGYVIVGLTYSYGAGGSDVWLIKTNASGNVVWTKTYGGSNNEQGYSVKQTTDGGYIISGTDAYDFSPYDDVYIIKTNSSGDILWTTTWNRPDANNDDRGGEIQLTDDGGYIMVGHSYNYNGNGIKVTLLKLNSSGTIEWWKAHGIEQDQRGSSVLQTDDGGYIFSAYTGLANPDFWLVKTDSAGDILWTKRFGGPSDEYPGQIMCKTADGGYVIVGYTASFGSGGNDVWLVKTDQSGNEMWNLPIGSSGDDRGVSVQQSVDGGFIITGRTNSFGAGNYDVWLLKLIHTGTISGTVTSGGTGLENVIISLQDENGLPVNGFDDIYTDANGEYSFVDVPAGDYQVMIVEPLGYIIDENPKQAVVVANETTTVDFLLTEVVVLNNARSKGYWKHQFDVYVKDRGHAQESAADLQIYIDEVSDRYKPHFSIFDDATDGTGDFEDWQAILSVKGNAGMEAKATAQLAALVLNIMSLKVGQYEVVTADNKTAGDVMTYVSELIEDGDGSNDELAKDLADAVNLQQTIAVGLVNPGQNILYKINSDLNFEIPESYTLYQNHPNPFNPTTIIGFTLPESGFVTLSIYNSLGEEVAVLVNHQMAAGSFNIPFDASGFTSGIYLYRINVKNFVSVKKMILLK
jgi:hypothetical protein